MKKLFFMALVMCGFSIPAFANVLDSANDLKLEVRLISEETLSDRAVTIDECSGRSVERFDLAGMISVGEQVWQIVKDGAATLDFTGKSTSAIPIDAICPFYMTNWQAPQSKTYQITYTDFLGINVIDFTYKVIYSYGGKYNGKGAYLANVSIEPLDIHVWWLHNLSATVEVKDILNVGTEEDPVAAIQIALNWTANNPLNQFKSSRTYFIDGNGNFKEL